MPSSLTDTFKNGALSKIMSTAPGRYRIALYSSASPPSASTSAYTSVGEIATVGTLYVNTGSAATSGWELTASINNNTMTFEDISKTTGANETLSAAYALIWDTLDSNKTIAFIDFGNTKTASNGGTFTIDFPAATITATVS